MQGLQIEEITQLPDIGLLISREAETMTGTGNGVDGFSGGAGIIIFLAHVAGDEVVVLAMEENHWHLAILH